MACIYCNSPFKERKDKRGYLRHSLTAKLYKGREVTVLQAINTFLHTSLSHSNELFICTDCFNSLGNLYSFITTRTSFCEKESSDGYISNKKRCTTPINTPRSIKKLKQSSSPKHDTFKQENTINSHLQTAVSFLVKRNYRKGVSVLANGTDGMRRAMRECCFDIIYKEMKEISKKSEKNILSRSMSTEIVQQFKWTSVVSELKLKAPTLYDVFSSMLSPQKVQYRTENLPPNPKLINEIGNMYSVLMFKRNAQCKTFQTLNSIQLWTGGCKSVVSERKEAIACIIDRTVMTPKKVDVGRRRHIWA
ncbi:unnamed protein product [Mytilus coruscus]|uniref:Uncharacterized protein n=1 Tax=Mytilus coruscus TaxID=42192 RepID=A0A6J8C7B3_MYTCO|nr:unnamed protein product [Mytilus coruscus]